MIKPYWTLFIREDGRWSPQFGDYSKAVVVQEMRDSWDEYQRRDRRIVCTDDTQEAINAAEAELNA